MMSGAVAPGLTMLSDSKATKVLLVILSEAKNLRSS
jgi:hypothetical protein